MNKTELKRIILQEVKKALKEVEGSTIYQYNFILSRGLFYDGQEEVSKDEMMNFIEEMWEEQGPNGYDLMHINASTNTETKDPVVLVELEEDVVLFSKVILSEEVAIKTAKKAAKDKIIQPKDVIKTLRV